MATQFNLIIDTGEELTPGDVSVCLLKVRSSVLGCQTQGIVESLNSKRIGEWHFSNEKAPTK